MRTVALSVLCIIGCSIKSYTKASDHAQPVPHCMPNAVYLHILGRGGSHGKRRRASDFDVGADDTNLRPKAKVAKPKKPRVVGGSAAVGTATRGDLETDGEHSDLDADDAESDADAMSYQFDADVDDADEDPRQPESEAAAMPDQEDDLDQEDELQQEDEPHHADEPDQEDHSGKKNTRSSTSSSDSSSSSSSSSDADAPDFADTL